MNARRNTMLIVRSGNMKIPNKMWYDEEKMALMGEFHLNGEKYSGIIRMANRENRNGDVFPPEVLKQIALEYEQNKRNPG